MKNVFRLFLLMLLAYSPAISSEPLSNTEIVLETSYQVLLVMDYKQTSQFHKYVLPETDGFGHSYNWQPGLDRRLIKEINPFLPKFPSQATINRVFILSSIGHIIITKQLSHTGRAYWQASTISVEAWVVNSNYILGIRIKL